MGYPLLNMHSTVTDRCMHTILSVAIDLNSAPHLNGKHVVFGEVTHGFDVGKYPNISFLLKPLCGIMFKTANGNCTAYRTFYP